LISVLIRRKIRKKNREYQINREKINIFAAKKKQMQQEKKVLLGMSLDELKAVVKALGMPQFTAGQIAKWLYQQHVTQID
jgi:23S rRNA (adenine2503-C2)-methyltransferase